MFHNCILRSICCKIYSIHLRAFKHGIHFNISLFLNRHTKICPPQVASPPHSAACYNLQGTSSSYGSSALSCGLCCLLCSAPCFLQLPHKLHSRLRPAHHLLSSGFPKWRLKWSLVCFFGLGKTMNYEANLCFSLILEDSTLSRIYWSTWILYFPQIYSMLPVFVYVVFIKLV
jgi:hypothetical protein